MYLVPADKETRLKRCRWWIRYYQQVIRRWRKQDSPPVPALALKLFRQNLAELEAEEQTLLNGKVKKSW